MKNTHGFTLIELLLYITIVSMLLLSITAFFAMSADSRVKNQSISEVNQQGTAAMERISAVIRNASSITSPVAAASSSSLTVVVPTASKSPTIISLGGTALQMKEGTAAAIALTNSKVQITNLTFKNLTRASTSGTVQISFAIGRINANNRAIYDYTRTFTTTASLRP